MKKSLLASVTSLALVAGAMTPMAAFAADVEDLTPANENGGATATSEDGTESAGQTLVTWIADDSQLDITVPTTIHAVAKADGTLQFAQNAEIVNNSIFAVHGTHYTTENAEGMELAADATAGDGTKNLISVQVVATGNAMDMGPAGDYEIAAGDLSLHKAGSTETVEGEEVATDKTVLGLSGDVQLADEPATVVTDAFTINWFFTAGLNAA